MLSGSAGDCAYSATATPRAAVAIADMTMTAPVGTCTFGGDPITGILDYDATTGKLRAYMPFDGVLDFYYLLATRK